MGSFCAFDDCPGARFLFTGGEIADESQELVGRFDKAIETALFETVVFHKHALYPGDTKSMGIIFCIDQAEVEYFNLGVNPIFRETYTLGHVKTGKKGYIITSGCIRCGKCQEVCPQNCIDKGTTYMIRQNNCLHCGNCYEHCPVKAIERR